MKYLLIAHYAGFSVDEPEGLTNNAWLLDETTDPAVAEEIAKKALDNFINETVDAHFDVCEEAMTDEEKEELAEFREGFVTHCTRIRCPSSKIETIATVTHTSGCYFENLKIDVLKMA